MNDFEKGYLIGAMDGEGCISISTNANKRLSRGFAFRFDVSIGQEKREFLEYIQKFTQSGTISSRHTPNRKLFYDLRFSKKELLDNGLLGFFAKHLKLKSEQAKLLYAYFQISDRTVNHLDQDLNDSIYDIKLKMLQNMQYLNGSKSKQQDRLGTVRPKKMEA